MTNYIAYTLPEAPGVTQVVILGSQTGQQYADSLGLTPDQWAEFDMDAQACGCSNYPNCFFVIDNQPLPNTVGFDFLDAQRVSRSQVIFRNNEESKKVAGGIDALTMSGQASLPVGSRSPLIQLSLDALNALAEEMGVTLTAIDSSTNITELNNIVNPPTGVLFTGRGSGLGPEDLNVSYYTAFNSASMTEAETELYVPGTATVIPYGSGGPNAFDSMGNAFNPGDYILQIREVATSRVIAEFECPLAPAGVDVAF